MDKKEILKRLNQERDYYNVEYLEKHKLNKVEFKNKIFLDFINGLKDSDFVINQQDNKLTFVGTKEIINVEQTTNIEENPKNPLIFNIVVSDNGIDKLYQFRPFNNSPLPNPDFSRLLSNPYKGKDLLDIEIEEEQKNIDYFKRFIAEKVDFEQYIYAFQFDSDDSMVEFNSIKELIGYIRKK